MNRLVRLLWPIVPGLFALMLAGCSGLPSAGPLEDQLIAQGNGGGRVDVVNVDDRVLATLLAQPQAPFAARFKKYTPPPRLPIAIGDNLSVVIWESSANGLFGRSLERPRPSDAEILTRLGAGGEAFLKEANTPGGLTALITRLESTAAGRALAQSFDPTGRTGTQIPDQPVGPDGAISIPYGGRIPVAGRTATDTQHLIEQRLSGKALDPQALVIVKQSLANSVTVSGEVIAGARVPLASGGVRLLQVIAAAGGAQAPVHDTYVRLSRDGITATVPMSTLVEQPDENIFARPGDLLTLVRKPKVLSVFGATGKNSAVVFDSDRLTLSEALGKSGGLLDDRAAASAVFLLRYEPPTIAKALGAPIVPAAHDGGSPIAYRIDLGDAKSYQLAQRFPVRDKDIIYVANAKSEPVRKFFQMLQTITGPIITGFLVCAQAKC